MLATRVEHAASGSSSYAMARRTLNASGRDFDLGANGNGQLSLYRLDHGAGPLDGESALG
ncbi:MAG: hypothetical protein JNL55_31420 [Steroidobacter sp.]|nr:hypothetical protein [Steroidobacter sp.]